MLLLSSKLDKNFTFTPIRLIPKDQLLRLLIIFSELCQLFDITKRDHEGLRAAHPRKVSQRGHQG
jgi:hypothetical protein